MNQPNLYHCLYCGRALEVEEYEHGNVIVHDDVPHPIDATFNEEDNPQ